MVRRQRSISFCGEEPMWKVMMSYGISEEDAHRCITKGCYEFCPPDGANATDMGMVSYVKPLERMLADAATNAFAAASYEVFEGEYLKRMTGTFAELLTLGAKAAATPDGRRKGEEFSKNLSPTMGADTEGVTALVHSLGAIASTDFPYDFPLDVMLLPVTVQGEKGIEMMKALLKVYYANDGVMMQFNVFSPELLREAQAHPDKFASLMVRVCGWGVRWNDLPKVEQDAYIRRAECIMQ